MSELIQKSENRVSVRFRLLTGVSTLAVLIASTGIAMAEDSDRPTVWIELGGQFQRVDAGSERFEPSFLFETPRPAPETISPATVPHAARFSTGGEASLTFMPRESDWVFSASVRYGRGKAAQHAHQQSYPVGYTPTVFGNPLGYKFPWAAQFIDVRAKLSESHVVADFQVGRDVGIGFFGRETQSTLSAGVRYAQFSSTSNVAFRSDPDWHFSAIPFPVGSSFVQLPFGQYFHSHYGELETNESFHGIGPSLSWKSSSIVAGTPEALELAVDWGVNGALLFGRQKARTHQHISAHYNPPGPFLATAQRTLLLTYDGPATPDHTRSRSVTVPNVGAFAGLSFKYATAKLSFGYRADFFFGAMDGGIDTAKTYDRNFYGPYATISIGLGG